MKAKIVIAVLGAHGMLGSELVQTLSGEEQFHVLPITRKDFDVERDAIEKLLSIFQTMRVEYCINTIADLSSDGDWQKAVRINAYFPQLLGRKLGDIGIKFIHVSTNGVFSGTKGRYTESDTPDANTMYGITKFLGESPYAMVIRTSIIGWSPYRKQGLLEWLRNHRNLTVEGHSHEIWNGVTTKTLADCIRHITSNNLYKCDTYHIFSPKEISKLELLMLLNERLKLNIVIKPNSVIKRNLTLITKHDSLLYDVPNIEQQVNDITYF